MIQWYFDTKMTKRCVRIAHGSEMGEKGVKMGKARLLPGVSRTWVKGNTRRQNPTYISLFPRTQNLKNILAYARIELCTHEYQQHM